MKSSLVRVLEHTRTRSHQNHQIKFTVFVCDSHCCRENMGNHGKTPRCFSIRSPSQLRHATQRSWRCLKGASVMRSHMGVPEDDGGVGQSGGNDHTVLCSNLRGASGTKVRETGDIFFKYSGDVILMEFQRFQRPKIPMSTPS